MLLISTIGFSDSCSEWQAMRETKYLLQDRQDNCLSYFINERMENSMVIISKAIPNAIWDIDRQIFYANNSKNRMLKHSVEIMAIENEFIRNYNPVIYCNDLTGENWCFDTKLPSGGWLENIKVTTNENGCTVYKALILC